MSSNSREPVDNTEDNMHNSRKLVELEATCSSAKCSCYMLYNKNEISKLFRDLTVLNTGNAPNPNTTTPIPTSDQPVKDLKVSAAMSCSSCSTAFSSQTEQREHFKSDWHRFNLKQKLKGEQPFSKEIYTSLYTQNDSIDHTELTNSPQSARTGKPRRARPSGLPSRLRTESGNFSSSSSSAESDDELSSDLEDLGESRRHPKIFLRNGDGKIITLYKCTLFGKQNSPLHDGEIIRAVCTLPEKLKWAILMIGGGHFAGAIFDGEEAIVHKTFHRYTVRGKQGTSQSSRDNRQVGGGPHSAGANMRRYNELTLVQEVQALFESWDQHLKHCHCIFYRAPGPNKSVLFGGKAPPFKRNSDKMRAVPFSTGRATFQEVQRIHNILCSVICYDNESDAFMSSMQLPPQFRRTASPVHSRPRKNKQQQNSPTNKGKKNSKENLNVSPRDNVLHKTTTKQASPTGLLRLSGDSSDEEEDDFVCAEMVVDTMRQLSPFGGSKLRKGPSRNHRKDNEKK